MPVTGVKQVKQNMKRAFKDISDKKSVQFINAVVSIGATASIEFAPVEYSVLVNSQMRNVDIVGNKVVGEVSFNASYAAALEFGVWKPVAAVNKEGPADNMKATPHFLQKGFESSESKTAIKQAQDIFKI